MFLACFCSVPAVTINANASEKSLKISANAAYLIDYHSGQVVYEKNADERLAIASMTKLASLAVIFDYLKNGISLLLS